MENTPIKPKKKKRRKLVKKQGRPTLMTESVIAKLEYAFGIGCNPGEALRYAGIKPDVFYDYCKRNPKFAEHIEALKDKPVLKARVTIDENLSQVNTAQWYLERKRKDEFSGRQEITGKDGQPVVSSEETQKLVAEYEEKLRQSILNGK